jgi:hypothetical protein
MQRLIPLAALALLAACAGGARDVDYSQERGISSDIAATYATGPTSMQNYGETVTMEPYGSIPWTAGERHE